MYVWLFRRDFCFQIRFMHWCAAYELEKSDVPGQLLHFLKQHAPTGVDDPIRQPSMNSERWASFREVSSRRANNIT